MALLSVTKFSSQLAATLNTRRRSNDGGGPNESGNETGLQRIGLLVSNANDVATVYYDPNTHTILYDDGLVAISQE